MVMSFKTETIREKNGLGTPYDDARKVKTTYYTVDEHNYPLTVGNSSRLPDDLTMTRPYDIKKSIISDWGATVYKYSPYEEIKRLNDKINDLKKELKEIKDENSKLKEDNSNYYASHGSFDGKIPVSYIFDGENKMKIGELLTGDKDKNKILANIIVYLLNEGII